MVCKEHYDDGASPPTECPACTLRALLRRVKEQAETPPCPTPEGLHSQSCAAGWDAAMLTIRTLLAEADDD